MNWIRWMWILLVLGCGIPVDSSKISRPDSKKIVKKDVTKAQAEWIAIADAVENNVITNSVMLSKVVQGLGDIGRLSKSDVAKFDDKDFFLGIAKTKRELTTDDVAKLRELGN